MNVLRFSAWLAAAGFATLLSGCVVAPIGLRPVAVYPARAVYVEPAPIIVVPGPGYYGYQEHHGHRDWR
ncbi:MAG: hypothetical protein HHJ16_06630 [Polaromonas sp.]|uniref:hypothetical protein n=1 Tax=Polaromonas sp. TaxID=1869339 RepID=UPI001811266D|nr:hypothetical protein [Polaromonas sp.]NMM09931.1 hypothetical protein [Polaromonas sp.]